MLIIIIFQDNGDGKYSWLNVKPPYNCAVASPKKESKLKGLKNYIAYQLTPSVRYYKLERCYNYHKLTFLCSSTIFKYQEDISILTGCINVLWRNTPSSQFLHCLINKYKVGFEYI